MRLFCWREAVCRENIWSKLNFWWNRVCKILFMHFRFGFKHEVLLISIICLYYALYSEHHLFEAWTISILIFCNAKFNHIRLEKMPILEWIIYVALSTLGGTKMVNSLQTTGAAVPRILEFAVIESPCFYIFWKWGCWHYQPVCLDIHGPMFPCGWNSLFWIHPLQTIDLDLYLSRNDLYF